MNSYDLINFQKANFTDYSIDKLVDLHQVKIDTEKTVNERMISYIKQVKNPYIFRVCDVKVQVNFSSERSFNEALKSAISSTVN